MRQTNRRRPVNERRMRLLVSRFEEEAEEERRQIARQLHNDIGQSLTLLVFLVSRLRQLSGEQPPEELSQAQKMATDLIAKTRDISLAIRPPIPEKIGLLPTLEVLFEDLECKADRRLVFRHSGLERKVPGHLATAIYRITQKTVDCFGSGQGQLAVSIRIGGRSAGISVRASGIAAGDASSQDKVEWIGYSDEIRERPARRAGKRALKSNPESLLIDGCESYQQSAWRRTMLRLPGRHRGGADGGRSQSNATDVKKSAL